MFVGSGVAGSSFIICECGLPLYTQPSTDACQLCAPGTPLSQLRYVSCFTLIFICEQDCHYLYANAIGL